MQSPPSGDGGYSSPPSGDGGYGGCRLALEHVFSTHCLAQLLKLLEELAGVISLLQLQLPLDEVGVDDLSIRGRQACGHDHRIALAQPIDSTNRCTELPVVLFCMDGSTSPLADHFIQRAV